MAWIATMTLACIIRWTSLRFQNATTVSRAEMTSTPIASDQGRIDMADIKSLRLLGFLLGGITVAVSLMAFHVVRTNVEDRSQNIETMAASQAMVGYR